MKPEDFRIVYAGTPDFAVPALSALIDAGYNVAAVYTQPDRPAGRGRKLQMSPVKTLAMEHNIVVEQPQSMRADGQLERLREFKPDLVVVAAFGQILPIEILNAPQHGCINIHASLLPRWRGAAPIQRAIEHGDEKSGVTIMQMAEGLDTGDMLFTAECDITETTTAAELHDTLAVLGGEALMQTLKLLHANQLNPQVQSEADTCYARKIEKSEAVINWRRPATEIHKQVCAFNSWPVAQTVLEGETIRIWQSAVAANDTTAKPIDNRQPGQVVSAEGTIDVATADGVLQILKVQPPGKKAMPVVDFLNSRTIPAGISLG